MIKLLLALFSTYSFAAGPQVVLEDFYKSYLDHVQASAGTSRTLLQAEKSEIKAIKGFFTPGHVKKTLERTKACSATKEPTKECDGNFFYCAQEAPTSVKVENMEKSGKLAEGNVVLCFNCGKPEEEKRTARAKLQLAKKSWKIDSIVCQ